MAQNAGTFRGCCVFSLSPNPFSLLSYSKTVSLTRSYTGDPSPGQVAGNQSLDLTCGECKRAGEGDSTLSCIRTDPTFNIDLNAVVFSACNGCVDANRQKECVPAPAGACDTYIGPASQITSDSDGNW